jgi:hypothetical protein
VDFVELQQPGADQLAEPEPGAVELVVAAGAGAGDGLGLPAQCRGGIRGRVVRPVPRGGAGKPDSGRRRGGGVAGAKADARELEGEPTREPGRFGFRAGDLVAAG